MNLRREMTLANRREDYYNQIKVKCKCSHVLIIPKFRDKAFCKYCGHYVYRNKATEFKDKLLQQMKKK